MSKILVIEDEPFLMKNLKELLTQNEHEAVTASDKKEAIQYILNIKDFDLYLIDVWLPDGDGFEICELIRKHSTEPILFLTACDDEDSIVKGLNLGADDYITKPFRTAELLSRIRANLRRKSLNQKTNVMQSGDIILDNTQERVYKNNTDLGLTPIEYHLLQVLMMNAGIIVKRELLLEKLWDTFGKFVEDNTLSVRISRLRNKVGVEYIETIRGFGYRFTKPVYAGLKQEEAYWKK